MTFVLAFVRFLQLFTYSLTSVLFGDICMPSLGICLFADICFVEWNLFSVVACLSTDVYLFPNQRDTWQKLCLVERVLVGVKVS